MKTLSQIIGLLLILGFATQLALAATYKYKDESGNIVYSQRPPENPDTTYEVMDNVRSHAIPGRSQSTPSSSNARQSIQDTQQQSQENEKVQQQVEQAEMIRKQNCEAAKKNLEIYTVYRRIQNEDGEMVRLNDDERRQGVEEAKKAIKEFCD